MAQFGCTMALQIRRDIALALRTSATPLIREFRLCVEEGFTPRYGDSKEGGVVWVIRSK